jgi:hypothetical protein
MPTFGPKANRYALGGTITTPTINGVLYRVHTFTANGNFVVGPAGLLSADDLLAGLDVEFMILAGGGGGGSANNASAGGGGGGAGGIRFGGMTLAPGSYPIVIGAGGAGGLTGFNPGVNGGDSSAFGLTATGGGGGGYGSSGGAGGAGNNGGNGGGGGNSAAGGISTNVTAPAQGSAIAGQTGHASSGLGGYGASLGAAVYGSNALSTGYIPQGVASSISGVTTVYARGGFPSSVDQADRAANTGDGGMGVAGLTHAGWAGGSGVVIIRYRIN